MLYGLLLMAVVMVEPRGVVALVPRLLRRVKGGEPRPAAMLRGG
jgi:hypothetical protein